MQTTICCLEPVLAPYSIPRFRALQALRPDWSVQMMALGATERIREWQVSKSELGFGYAEGVPGVTVEDIEPRILVSRVTEWLERHNPVAVVITGYYYPAMRAAARWAKRRRRASLFMGDSQWGDKRRNPLREWLKGRWVRSHYDAAFVAGERATAYLKSMGLPHDRIWTGYDVVDNDFFHEGAEAARAQASVLRKQLGVPDRFFVYVGRFASEKNVVRLIDAYARYRSSTNRDAWGLVLVGSGPLEIAMRRQAQGLPDVVFSGFQQRGTLPMYYGLASCLVLPSVSEPWGLVVNEAMASGLPVLVSHKCGCVPELVRQGVNGYVCDPMDVEGLARLMRTVSSGTVDLTQMGKASRRIIALYTPETWAATLADCVERMGPPGGTWHEAPSEQPPLPDAKPPCEAGSEASAVPAHGA